MKTANEWATMAISGDCSTLTSEDPEHRIEQAIEAAQNEAYESALDDAVRTLKHCGSLEAAKLLTALADDRKRIRQGKKTEFPSLRESVPLPL